MKPSPIQLQQLSFRRISIEADLDRENGRDGDNFRATDGELAFEDVSIATRVAHSKVDDAEGDYFVLLHVIVKNAPEESDPSSRASVYSIDIEAGALIRVVEPIRARPDVLDIVIINGAALLWSAIREQVANLTARMPPGLATLPTVHFQDLKQATTGNAPSSPIEAPVAEAKAALARPITRKRAVRPAPAD